MTTLGHLLVILMWVFGVVGAMLGLLWVRWQRERHRIEGERWAEYWRQQPP